MTIFFAMAFLPFRNDLLGLKLRNSNVLSSRSRHRPFRLRFPWIHCESAPQWRYRFPRHVQYSSRFSGHFGSSGAGRGASFDDDKEIGFLLWRGPKHIGTQKMPQNFGNRSPFDLRIAPPAKLDGQSGRSTTRPQAPFLLQPGADPSQGLPGDFFLLTQLPAHLGYS